MCCRYSFYLLKSVHRLDLDLVGNSSKVPTYLFEINCRDSSGTQTYDAADQAGKCVRVVVKETNVSKCTRILSCWGGQGAALVFNQLFSYMADADILTNDRAEKDTQVSSECKPTESSCLSLESRILREHGSHSATKLSILAIPHVPSVTRLTQQCPRRLPTGNGTTSSAT